MALDVLIRYSCPDCGNLEETEAAANSHYQLTHPKCRQDNPRSHDDHECLLFANHGDPHECACGEIWLD